MWARWTGWDLAARQLGVVVVLECRDLLDGNRDRSAIRLWCACSLESQQRETSLAVLSRMRRLNPTCSWTMLNSRLSESKLQGRGDDLSLAICGRTVFSSCFALVIA